MARFARIDSQIRANRLILANRFRVPKLNLLFCESLFEGLKFASRRLEAICENRSHVMKIKVWRVPNPPGANPLLAERAPLRSSQSCVTRD